MKISQFQKIFAELLPDHYGFISKETVYKTVLSEEIKKIIKPLIDELEDLEEKLDFEDFSNAMENLIKVLNPSEKSILLQTSKAKLRPEIHDFKPNTNFSLGKRQK